MIPLVELSQLAARLGVSLVSGTSDGDRAAAALEDASALVRAEANSTFYLDAGSDEEILDTVPPVIAAVTLAVAMRAYRNHEGLSRASVGDVSVSYRDPGVAALALTSTERRIIRREMGLTTGTSVELEGLPVVRGDPGDLHLAPILGQEDSDPVPMGPPPWGVL